MPADGRDGPRPGPNPSLVDHHCHTVVAGVLERPDFERLLTEGSARPPAGTSSFHAPVGLAVRRWCAPLLDLEPLARPDDYLQRRADLGAIEVNRRLLSAAGMSAMAVDTGHHPADATTPDELGDLAGATVAEVVRIEQVAEAALATTESPRSYSGHFERLLRRRAEVAVGLKSIVAYRGGFRLPPSPDVDAVVRAVEAHQSTPDRRLEDPVLLRHGLDVAGDIAAERGLPVQFHAGFGDTDLQLDRANPVLLTPVLRDYGHRGITVTLLHNYPYHREAGYLAAVFPHVHFDVGLALPFLGASSARVLSEALELAPFDKQLYSSDAFGLAELYVVSAALFRRGIHDVTGRWVAEGDCTGDDADAIVAAVSSDTARRLYPFPDTPD